MATKVQFPVKEFLLAGSAITEQRRAAVVRAAMTALSSPKKAASGTTKKTTKVTRTATASGSGKVSFVFVTHSPRATLRAGEGFKVVTAGSKGKSAKKISFKNEIYESPIKVAGKLKTKAASAPKRTKSA